MKNKIEAMQLGKAVFILPNPINLQELSQEPKPRRNNRFLYLGWYIKEKGVYDLVDAAEILLSKGINIKIDFFGTVQEGKLREYVETKRLAHAISVNGWINGKGKIDKLLTCTGLVLPSYTEGIPNVILEAMATKTPIISTLVGGLKEVLRDGENAIIVKPGNPADLSEKMKQCLEDEGLRKKIALQGYQEAKTKYDVRVIRQQFGNIVAQVLS